MTGLLEQTEFEGGASAPAAGSERLGGSLEASGHGDDEGVLVVGRGCSPADVRRAVEVAREEQRRWALKHGKERAGVLRSRGA